MTFITCSVPNCPSSSLLNKELKFHQFPYSDERRIEWILACNGIELINEDWNFFMHQYVCSLHFDRYSYNKKGFLSRYAVPTLYLDKPGPINQINLKCAETQTESVPESTDNESKDSKIKTQKEGMVSQCTRIVQGDNSGHDKKSKANKMKPRNDDIVLQSTGTLESNNSDHIFIKVKKIGNDDFLVSSSSNVKVAVTIGQAGQAENVGEDINESLNDFDLNLNNSTGHKKRRIENNINIAEQDDNITLSQFLKACDDFLPGHLREIVKSNAMLYKNQIPF